MQASAYTRRRIPIVDSLMAAIDTVRSTQLLRVDKSGDPVKSLEYTSDEGIPMADGSAIPMDDYSCLPSLEDDA